MYDNSNGKKALKKTKFYIDQPSRSIESGLLNYPLIFRLYYIYRSRSLLQNEPAGIGRTGQENLIDSLAFMMRTMMTRRGVPFEN